MDSCKKYINFISIVLLLIPVVILQPFYIHNQNTYFVKAFYRIGFLQEDWLAKCQSTTSEFDMIIGWLLGNFPNCAELIMHVILLFLYALLLYYMFKILRYFNSDEERILAFFSISVLLCLTTLPLALAELCALPPSVGLIPSNGLAGFRLISDFQPSSFGVLLVPGIYYYLKRKYALAAFFYMMAPLIHTPNIVFSGLAMSCVVYELLQSRNWKELVIVLMVASPIAIVVLMQTLPFAIGDGDILYEARKFCIEERSPHHHLIERWVRNTVDWAKFILLILGIWLFPGRLKRMYVFMGGAVLLLSFFQYITNNQTIAMLSPWRISVVWIPLVSIFTMMWVLKRISFLKTVQRNWSIVAILFFVSVVAKQNYIETRSPKITELSDFNGHLLIPTTGEWGEKSKDVRLKYLIPVFADFKSHPYRPDELLLWKERILSVNAFYNSPDTERLNKIQAIQKVNAFVWPKSMGYMPEVNYDSRQESEHFYLYHLQD